MVGVESQARDWGGEIGKLTADPGGTNCFGVAALWLIHGFDLFPSLPRRALRRPICPTPTLAEAWQELTADWQGRARRLVVFARTVVKRAPISLSALFKWSGANMDMIILTVLLAVVAGALGLLAGRYFWPKPSAADQITLATLQGEAKRFSEDNVNLKVRSENLEADLRNREEKLAAEVTASARLDERVNLLTNDLASVGQRLQDMGIERDNALASMKNADEEVARLNERLEAVSKEAERLREREGKLQETLKTEFENIATKVLKANASELSDTSQKQIAAVLDPLRERLQEFKGMVENTYETEKRDVLSLKEQIKLVMDSSRTLGLQADGLAKALKGDVQMLGRWGELVLERVLQAAGLVEGREYIIQGRGLALKSEDGLSQKPDVIVQLPEKRTMIIDSKVSLASYDRLIAAQDDRERKEYATQFVRDVKTHIDGLSNKRYQDADQLAAHDCVLMFVPIEGALAAALMADPELFTYAWDKRVVLVGPSTLLMTMRTVASIWRYEKQAQNSQEIAKMAGLLCDKVSFALSDLNIVADKLRQALSSHNDAVKRLATGKGNALNIGERIRSLGVKTKGPMPAMIVDDEPVRATSELPTDINEMETA